MALDGQSELSLAEMAAMIGNEAPAPARVSPADEQALLEDHEIVEAIKEKAAVLPRIHDAGGYCRASEARTPDFEPFLLLQSRVFWLIDKKRRGRQIELGEQKSKAVPPATQQAGPPAATATTTRKTQTSSAAPSRRR